MSLLGKLFRNTEGCAESVVLIDISAESVAGAYVRLTGSESPTLVYTRRLPIETRTSEAHEAAMMRALKILGDELVREGAPALMRATGSGSADAILVSIDAPWQETSVRTQNFERTSAFTFTKGMVTTAIEKTRGIMPGRRSVDESIIGTILNGYETRNPYGRKVRRASVIVLTSHIDEAIAESINTTLRGLFHTKCIRLIAGSSLRYQAIRAAFPHERDALILDATSSLISVALVRGDLFIALAEISDTDDDRPMMDKIVGEFAVIAEDYPLPRTIFLLARESNVSSFQKSLASGKLGKLWLSDNPPRIIPVLAGHLAGSVRQTSATPPDLQLLLMALFYQHRP